MSGVGRASVVLGAGTIVSRITGLLRTIVLVAVLGSVGSRAGDAFALANQLPNNIYAVVSAGILTAVLVPQIVRASAHADGGRGFISALFTAGIVVLLAITAIATACAPLLVDLYAADFPPDQRALATAFAYWCVPQIFFYGLYALLGETLNARKVFGPFTWAPIVNNLVSIVGFIALLVLFGSDLTSVSEWTAGMIALLGGTATAGIALQAAILLLFWHRTGLALRPDFHWRGIGLGQVVRLAGWTTAMVIVGQVAGLIQTRIVSEASGLGPSVFAMQNAWLIFMLPYSVIVLSIGTPYFTRLSENAAQGRHGAVQDDIERSIRVVGLLIVIAAAILVAASAPASRIFVNSADDALVAAPVLVCYLASLLPLSVLFILQRTFYAYDDTRTPFVFTTVQGMLVVATAVVAAGLLPPAELAAGVALGQSVAITVQAALAGWMLHRRLGGIRVRRWLGELGRFAVAAVPAAAAGWAIYLAMGGSDGWALSGKLAGAIATLVIAIVGLAVYVAMLALLRTPDLVPAVDLVRRIVGRR